MSALLMVAIAIAIGTTLAAAGQSPQDKGRGQPRARYRSIPGEFADGCRALSGVICMPFAPVPLGSDQRPTQSQASHEMQPQGLAGRVGAASGDAGLLHQRMKVLQVDPDEFAHANPAIMGRLTICCVQCGSAAECARDLSDPWADLLGQRWRDYCPNAAMLRMISALRATGISSFSEAGVTRLSADNSRITHGH